jgi:hypothetical protein
MDNQSIIIQSNEYLIKIIPSTPRFCYVENNKILFRCLSGCRGHLNDTLYFDYHENPKRTDRNFQLLIEFQNKIQKDKFLSNLDWFNSWQEYLGMKPAEIITNNASLCDKRDICYTGLTLVSFDPKWFNMGLIQNTFLTFILKLMMYHRFNQTINYTNLYDDVPVQEQEYLKIINKSGFLFYLNHITKIVMKSGWGTKGEDFWQHHHSHGFANNWPVIKRCFNIDNLTKFETKHV